MLTEYIRDYNLFGRATFPVKGKLPLNSKWKNLEPDTFFDESIYDGEYAVKLEPTDLIVDIDPRNFPEGTNPWHDLKQDLKLDKFENNTFIVKTGGGGLHIYLKKPADICVRKNLKRYPGVDFLGGYDKKGLYVIGPGSNHASGNTYKVLKGSLETIIDAPKALLDAIERGVNIDDKPDRETNFSDDPQNIARFKDWLLTAPLAIQGENGDLQTYKVACRGRDFNLSEQTTLSLLLECYNPRCNPPWDPEAFKTKVTNAYKYSEMPQGTLDPAQNFDKQTDTTTAQVMLAYDAWDNQWLLKADTTPKAVLKNAVMYMTIWPDIHTCVQFNELSQNIEVTGRPPWHDRRSGKNWTDSDTAHLKYLMTARVKTEFPTNTLFEAIYIIASRHTYHPIRDYLKDLKWDGTPRLDKWLNTYCGVEQNEYTQAVGRKTLVAAVTRVMAPGCKADHVLVLEGAQNIGKSYAVAILGGDYFGDFNVDPGAKDTVDAMRGKWIVELPEMAAVRKRKDVEELKAFITRTEDRVRFAYARATSDLPRQCIFIGTVNPDGAGYLIDQTGNRRFWPVLCGPKIDITGLKRDRDQLYAEAYEEGYMKKEKLYIDDELLQLRAVNESNSRVEGDPWIEIIEDWTNNAGKDIKSITTLQIYEIVLNGVIKNITKYDQIRIGKALVDAGWIRRRESFGCRYYRDINAIYPEAR